MKIVDLFVEFLASPKIKVKDIVLLGSSANYNYTSFSDLDIHLIVDELEDSEIDAQEFFDTKKYLWQQSHKVDVDGIPVEMYVQQGYDEIESAGQYSIQQDKWLAVPKKHKHVDVDIKQIKQRAQQYVDKIEGVLSDKSDWNSGTITKVQSMIDELKKLRKAGLKTKAGELSVDNLIYKTIRNNGYIEKLFDAILKMEDKIMNQ